MKKKLVYLTCISLILVTIYSRATNSHIPPSILYSKYAQLDTIYDTVYDTIYDTIIDSTYDTCRVCMNDCGNTYNYTMKYDGPHQIACGSIYDNGVNIGIGTNSPTTKLQVDGQSLWLTGGNGAGFSASAGQGLRLYYDATNQLGMIYAHKYGIGTANLILQNPGGNLGISTSPSSSFAYSGITFHVTGSTLPPTSGNIKLDVNGTVRALAYYATSDENMKTGVKPLEASLDKVLKLNGKTYQWSTEKYPESNMDNLQQIGFLAQELGEVIPEAVIVDKNGNYAVNYTMVIPVLTEAIKEQNKIINELKAKINTLSSQGEGAKTEIEEKDKALLYQNTPNPFASQTKVKVYLPQTVQNAYVMVYDMTGAQIKKYTVSQTGDTEIIIDALSLKAGMYMYSLIVDNKEVDTKRMILTEK